MDLSNLQPAEGSRQNDNFRRGVKVKCKKENFQ